MLYNDHKILCNNHKIVGWHFWPNIQRVACVPESPMYNPNPANPKTNLTLTVFEHLAKNLHQDSCSCCGRVFLMLSVVEFCSVLLVSLYRTYFVIVDSRAVA